MIQGAGVVAAAATGLWVAAVLWLFRPPRQRLAVRVRPYAAAALSQLGRPVPQVPVAGAQPSGSGGLVGRLAQLFRGGGNDAVLQQRLEQSGVYAAARPELIGEHRARQVLAGLAGGVCGLLAGVAVGLSPLAILAVGVVGVGAGALRPSAALDKAIQSRRESLRMEIPPLCQLLALRLRANGSVVSALTQTLARTQGCLAEELSEALAQHRAGKPLDDALEAAATATPEPESARVHRLLAGTIRHGLDAAPELLRLAREARESHMTRLRRDSTKRRAAILLPVIGLLAPLMLLFIAAPLPGLVLGGT